MLTSTSRELCIHPKMSAQLCLHRSRLTLIRCRIENTSRYIRRDKAPLAYSRVYLYLTYRGFLDCRGAYYWRKATRTEQIQVKIVVADDESSSEIVVQGDDEQIDRMRRELGLMEKGMVYVKGILEQ